MKKNKSWLFISLLFCLLSLSSCAALSGSKKIEKRLNSPENIVYDVDEYRFLQGTFPYLPGESVFEALVVANSKFVDITLFLPTGQTFCHTSWDGRNFAYESAFIENGTPFGVQLINDFINLYSVAEKTDVMQVRGKNYSYTAEVL